MEQDYTHTWSDGGCASGDLVQNRPPSPPRRQPSPAVSPRMTSSPCHSPRPGNCSNFDEDNRGVVTEVIGVTGGVSTQGEDGPITDADYRGGSPNTDETSGSHVDGAVGVDGGASSIAANQVNTRKTSERYVVRHGVPRSTSVMKLAEERKAHLATFYRNGDRWYSGLVVAVSTERFRSMSVLLQFLSESPQLRDQYLMPGAVRFVYMLDGTRVTSPSQLEADGRYVACSTKAFKPLDYGCKSPPSWHFNQLRSRGCCFGMDVTPKRVYADVRRQVRRRPFSTGSAHMAASEDARTKLITVVRNGTRPRHSIRLLLNARVTQSMLHVFDEITARLKVNSGTVKRVFAQSGKAVRAVDDFYGDDTVYFAYGTERHSIGDFELRWDEMRNMCLANLPGCKFGPRGSKSASQRLNNSAGGLDTGNHAENDNPGDHKSGQKSSFAGMNRNKVNNNGTLTAVKPRAMSELIISAAEQDRVSLPRQLMRKYFIGSQLVVGRYTEVIECLHIGQQLLCGLTVINKMGYEGKEHLLNNELSIMRRLEHPNILRLYEELDTPVAHYLIFELVKGGDLFEFIAACPVYTENDASEFLFHVTSGLTYLHATNIVHRDIRPRNILVQTHPNGEVILKIADFGCAALCDTALFDVCGDPTYSAPEMMSHSGYDTKADVWSTGVIAYTILCGKLPFSSDVPPTALVFDDPIWLDVSSDAKELVAGMLQVDPSRRWTAEAVNLHQWIADETVAGQTSLKGVVCDRLANLVEPKHPSGVLSGVAILAVTAMDKADDCMSQECT